MQLKLYGPTSLDRIYDEVRAHFTVVDHQKILLNRELSFFRMHQVHGRVVGSGDVDDLRLYEVTLVRENGEFKEVLGKSLTLAMSKYS